MCKTGIHFAEKCSSESQQVLAAAWTESHHFPGCEGSNNGSWVAWDRARMASSSPPLSGENRVRRLAGDIPHAVPSFHPGDSLQRFPNHLIVKQPQASSTPGSIAGMSASPICCCNNNVAAGVPTAR